VSADPQHNPKPESVLEIYFATHHIFVAFVSAQALNFRTQIPKVNGNYGNTINYRVSGRCRQSWCRGRRVNLE
jgi:hypothetical protein